MLTAARVNVHNSAMRAAFLSALALLAACGGATRPETAAPPREVAAAAPARPAPQPLIASGWALAGRAKPVEGEHAMVVSGHPLASAVGLEILERGGNAVDAGVAVGFALAVVYPIAGNIGGGGFMVIREAKGTVRTLDFREAAPRRATHDMYLDAGGSPTDASLTGHLSAGVPGSVAGLYEAQRRHGRLPWAEVVAPAIRLAREGYVLDAGDSRGIALEAHRLRRFPASRSQFLVDGQAPAPGTRFVQLLLASTLQQIADSGARAFYRGRIADLIVKEMQRGHGLITREDLADYRPRWRSPIELSYRGYTIYTMAPPSGGGITLGEILNVMEGYRPLQPFGSAALMHLEAEAMRRAFTDRNTYLGDPDFVDMPVERLLSKSYAAKLRAEIDPQRATPSAPFAGARREGTETTHYSVVDADGTAVSCTTTLNDDFGSAVTVTGAGFLLNDEMDDFAVAPGKPNLYGLIQGEANAIAPGKRMLSAMTPSIVLDPAGKLFLVLGSPGGSRITTAVYQVISNVIDHDMTLADALGAPRLHHQGLPDTVYLERGGFVQAAIDSLKAMGHEVGVWGFKTSVNAIQRTAAGWVGVSDPRRGGGAAGY